MSRNIEILVLALSLGFIVGQSNSAHAEGTTIEQLSCTVSYLNEL